MEIYDQDVERVRDLRKRVAEKRIREMRHAISAQQMSVLVPSLGY